LIIFGDLVGSTEVAVEASPSFFARTYIASFHWAAHKALQFVEECQVFGDADFSEKISDIKIAGDEVHAFIPLDPEWQTSSKRLQDLVASTISFAYVAKLYWLAAPYNLQRMLGRQFPRDISVGLHIGRAAPVQNSGTSDVAGLHINMTKRIESQARDAKESRILASRDVTEIFEKWRKRHEDLDPARRPPLWFTRFFERPPISGKGLPRKLGVLELGQAETRPDDLLFLVRQLATTPETVDVPAEMAVRIMAETFIPHNQPLFDDQAKSISVKYEIPDALVAESYIEKWFSAIDLLPKIFLDEPWLLFNCFFVSWALIRHPAVNSEQRKRYVRIGDAVFSRLRKMLEQGH
jgi:class 3 adenylate cyclase